MKNVTLAIFALIFLITVASASDIHKRTCGSSKRDVLGKRNPEKCPCQLAFVDFETTPVRGYVVLAQDECGSTTVTGIFTQGIKTNTTFELVDDCDRTLEDLGNLGVRVNDDGSTKSFRRKFEFDLNCTKDGVFNRVKGSNYRKRTCNYKRQAGGTTGVSMKANGDPASTSPAYTT